VNTYQPQFMTPGVSQQMIPQQMVQMPLQCKQHLTCNYNFLYQPQGTYVMNTFDGANRISVLMPHLLNQGCTIVRRVSSDGEALSDQMIFEEQNQCILYSMDNKMLAYTEKDRDMRMGISWTSMENVHDFIWKRTVPSAANPKSMQDLSCTSRSSGLSIISSVPSAGNPKSMQDLSCTSRSSGLSILSSPEAIQSPLSIDRFRSHEYMEMTTLELEQEENLFDMIKTYCSRRPNLLKKVVLWGLSTDKDPSAPIKINPEKVKEMASGRMWVSCMIADAPTMGSSRDITPEQDAVNNLKGAYQEEPPGSCIYVQPKPGTGMQHRLRKENNFWLIEECNSDTQTWELRAQELPGKNWLDKRNVHITLKVKLISLTKIISRMSDSIFDNEIEEQLDFLFRDCDQKKLNTKLKTRNLKHNIQNVKGRLEKQHCLAFAIRVVNVPDAITREHDVHG